MLGSGISVIMLNGSENLYFYEITHAFKKGGLFSYYNRAMYLQLEVAQSILCIGSSAHNTTNSHIVKLLKDIDRQSNCSVGLHNVI